MAQTPPPRISVEAQVESLETPSLTSHPGCRPLVIVLGICTLVIGLAFAVVAGWVVQQHLHGSKPRHTTPHDTFGNRDGQFSFRVEQTNCGAQQLGPPGHTQTAAGQFCVYVIHVVNVGDQPRILLPGIQHAIVRDGKKYNPNVIASEEVSPVPNPFPDILWRGQEFTFALAFDVPVGVTPVALELHDSPLSGGVKVKL